MAYRYGNRKQRMLFPQSINEYIPEDAQVRAYDLFVDSLDFDQLGIAIDSHKVGCPQYDPRAMLKLLIYGYSYGIRSSRKLEREAHYNLSFIWLTGGLKPAHKTIGEFRRNNKVSLGKVLKQCTRLCIEFGHIKRNLNGGYFLMRGLDGAKAEMSLLACCFNITRMISIIGVTGISDKLVS